MNANYLIYGTLQKRNRGMFLVLLFLMHSTVQFAATPSNDTLNMAMANSLRIKALKYDKKNDIYNAIEYYRRYLALQEKDTKLTYRLAMLYLKTRDYSNAKLCLDAVLPANSRKLCLAFYYKGIVCMNLEKYDEAIESFTRFRRAYKVRKDKYNFKKLAAIYIESSGWAKSQVLPDGKIEIILPGDALNHRTIDFSPFSVDDHTLLYGAVFSDTSNQNGAVRQIFKAEMLDGQWKSVGLLDGAINDRKSNTGNAVLSENGNRLFFTRSKKNWKDEDISEIYFSDYDGTTWQVPEKLPFPVNDENYTTSQPAVGKNLKTGNDILYFVSDRPGGKGGLDIWCAEFDDKTKKYKEPIDLDRGVNTLGDECCPFYDMSGRTLYFSSNGRKNGLGGYDIFKALGSSKRWAEAIPLPKPINSSFDEYYFTMLKNNTEGFFSSNRPGSLTLVNGGCCDDIYSFQYNTCVRIHSHGTVKNARNYDFYNDLNDRFRLNLKFPDDNIALADVPVELYLSGENEKDEILISKTATDDSGDYHFDLEKDKHYAVLVKNYGYFEKKVHVNTVGIDCYDTLGIGITRISYIPKVNFQISIYYDHDKYKLSDIARRTIDTTLVPIFDLFPNAVIEIGSHTDNTGSDLYNMNLSQKRSESVVNYLISRGISAGRLIAKGYGMRFPIALNINEDGSDNAAGRQLNRRTEIRIVGELNTFNIDE
jgi:OmpA-OmpF porin, OOP family